MFNPIEEIIANYYLPDKQLRAWYLRSSYNMQKAVACNDERISSLYYSIHASIQIINLLSKARPAEIAEVYPDKDFRNFVCYDTTGRIYWVREDHTPEEEQFISENKDVLDNFTALPVTLSDGFNRTVIRSTRENQPENEYLIAIEI